MSLDDKFKSIFNDVHNFLFPYTQNILDENDPHDLADLITALCLSLAGNIAKVMTLFPEEQHEEIIEKVVQFIRETKKKDED